MTSSLLLLLAGFACKNPTLAAPVAVPAPSAPSDASSNEGCEAVLRDLRASWGLMHTAAVAAAPTEDFLEAWRQTAPECRSGTWYLLAARRLREASPPLTTTDGLSFSGPRQALEAGLAAAPNDGGLLAFVTYGASASPNEFPPIPTDACARLAAGDDQAYVCGVLALRAGRFADAADLLGAVRQLAVYPDGDLCLRKARAGAGRPAGPDPVSADRSSRCARFGATADECARLAP